MAGAGEQGDAVSQADTLYAKGARWAPFVVTSKHVGIASWSAIDPAQRRTRQQHAADPGPAQSLINGMPLLTRSVRMITW